MTVKSYENLKTFVVVSLHIHFDSFTTNKTNFNFSGDVPEIKKNFFSLIQEVLKNSQKFSTSSIIRYGGSCGQCENFLCAIVIWNFASPSRLDSSLIHFEHLCTSVCTYPDTMKWFLNHADPGLSHTLKLLCFPFLHINHSVPKLLLSLLMSLNR